MFHLSVVDHIRLSFATVAAAYQRHADAASRLDRLSWYTKIVLVSLTGLACVLALIALQRGHGFQIAAASAAGVAFVGCAVYVALDLEPRIYGHRATAARFWLLTEKYRALLADVHDKVLDVAAIADRREALMQESRAVFEHAPPADRQTYEIAKAALTGGGRKGYSEEEIDALLPESLRRPKGAAA
jgi:conflict system pore-forming effector with SLATT domain